MINIIQKGTASTVRATADKLQYSGVFMEIPQLTVTVKSPTAIAFEIGDFITWGYDSLTYTLKELPQLQKQATSGSYGEAFVYENMIFKSALADVKYIDFLDVVPSNSTSHFSSLPTFSFYGNMFALIDRLNANLGRLYANWVVQAADVESGDIYDALYTERQVDISSPSKVWDALGLAYSMWGLGWVYYYDTLTSKHTIVIGAEGGATGNFSYGQGNGLYMVGKAITKEDSIVTRLRAYGSTRNMPARYYNNKVILNDRLLILDPLLYMPNLMIPYDKWATIGDTDTAYINCNNADIEALTGVPDTSYAKYGIREKSIFFDGNNNLKEIYPTIEQITAGEMRAAIAGYSGSQYALYYSPNATAYPDATRLDKVLTGDTLTDDGIIKTDTIYSETATYTTQNGNEVMTTEVITKRFDPIYFATLDNNGEYRIAFTAQNLTVTGVNTDIEDGTLRVWVQRNGSRVSLSKTVPATLITGGVEFAMPEIEISVPDGGDIYAIELDMDITIPTLGEGELATIHWVIDSGTATYTLTKVVPNRDFTISLRQIGFDIFKFLSNAGQNPVISLTSGACTGREFQIKRADYVSASDSWLLTCTRQSDTSINQWFPNKNFHIVAEDTFVLLNINMPDILIDIAELRLYDEACKWLRKAKEQQYIYEPKVDEVYMALNHQVIKEGMMMPLTDSDLGISGSKMINSLTINENDSAVRTFEVVLREDTDQDLLKYINAQAKQQSSSAVSSITNATTSTSQSVESLSVSQPTQQTELGYTPENIANKTSVLSENSTSAQYLNAKALYDRIALLPHYSFGAVEFPTITDNGDGSVTIGNGTYCLADNVEGKGFITCYTIAGNTFTLTDLTQNYIVANYNSGTPVLQVITNVTLINETTIVPVFSIFRRATILHTQWWNMLGAALTNKIHQSIVKTQRYRRESGLSVSEYGTRNLNMTSGRVWIGAVPMDLSAILTATDNMFFWYHSAGNWTSSVIQSYNNTQYDNGTNLVELTNNRYAVNWIYRGVESQKHIYIVLGTSDYSLSDAQGAVVPALPAAISSHAVLIGKLIVQKNAATATSIQSAFDVQFSFSAPAAHNDLTGIQGGAINEYYHLSSAQVTIATQSATAARSGYLTSTDWSTFNGKQAAITGAATTILSNNLTASRALVSDSNGKVAVSAVTSSELGYVGGVTSAIQTQLNGKAATGQTFYIGTTQVAINRTSAALSLTGVSIDGNSGTATKLLSSRTLWGRTFDGTANVIGALDSVTDINATGKIKTSGTLIIPSTIPTLASGETAIYSLDSGFSGETPSGAGTLTSVALTMPTGFSVSGSPITESGTFGVTFASGYRMFTETEIGNKIESSLIGVANGIAPLDSGGKVALGYLPSTLLKYIGVWNASTNTPTLLATDTTKKGYVYNVSVAGTQFGIVFKLGDWLIYNDSGVAEKSDNSDDVVSVNGYTGAVTLKTSDIAEQTNLYYTDARVAAYSDLNYLGISAKAADSDKLDGQDSTYFATATNLSNHTSATNNPHSVTAAQVGALALSGGIINGTTANPLIINTTNALQSSIDFKKGGVWKGAVGYYSGRSFIQNANHTLNIYDNGDFKLDANIIYHSANSNSTSFAWNAAKLTSTTLILPQTTPSLASGEMAIYGLESGFSGELPSGAGSVTSISMVVPTGLSVTPATITESGTFTISYASGYSIPTNTKQGEWDNAYTLRHNAVTLGTANGLSLSTQILSLALATASTNGAMSSTQFNKLAGIAEGANNYSLPLAASGTRGGIQIGYTASGANLPLLLSSEKAYIALTKSAIESVLTGAITSHTHAYLSDSDSRITNWDSAYNDKINSVTFTASTLTLTQQDAGTIAVSVPTFNQNTTGSAATLTTPRAINISVSGVSGTAQNFNGSAAITIPVTLTTLTRGSYLTGNNYNGGTATTWAVDATTAATAGKVVARDANADIFVRDLNASRKVKGATLILPQLAPTLDSGEVGIYSLESGFSGETPSGAGSVESVALVSNLTGISVTGSPITTSGTFTLNFVTGYSIPTNTKQGEWDIAYTNRITSLTTTGSGAATLVNNVLNIPTYTLPTATGSILGGVKIGSNITITDGVISVAAPYTLPTATSSVLGGVKIGTNVAITDGVISVHNALTLGTANGLSLSTQVLSLALASTSTNGALSSTDWNTFNGKQSKLIGTGANSLVRVNTSGVIAYDDNTYLTGNQTITLSGIITGSGTTAITTAIADGALSIAKTNGLQSALDVKMATASYPDLVAIEALTGTSGFLKKIAANTWGLDTNTYLTDITKALVEAVLTGTITSHNHTGTYALISGATTQDFQAKNLTLAGSISGATQITTQVGAINAGYWLGKTSGENKFIIGTDAGISGANADVLGLYNYKSDVEIWATGTKSLKIKNNSVEVLPATQSTAYTNGSLILAGGLGIAKDLYSNGKAVFASSVQMSENINTNLRIPKVAPTSPTSGQYYFYIVE